MKKVLTSSKQYDIINELFEKSSEENSKADWTNQKNFLRTGAKLNRETNSRKVMSKLKGNRSNHSVIKKAGSKSNRKMNFRKARTQLKGDRSIHSAIKKGPWKLNNTINYLWPVITLRYTQRIQWRQHNKCHIRLA